MTLGLRPDATWGATASVLDGELAPPSADAVFVARDYSTHSPVGSRPLWPAALGAMAALSACSPVQDCEPVPQGTVRMYVTEDQCRFMDGEAYHIISNPLIIACSAVPILCGTTALVGLIKFLKRSS